MLLADYSIDCNSGFYLSYRLFSLLLVLIWPIGLPLLIFYKMFVVRHLIRDEDEDTMKEFDFILGDYKTTHWYWEVIELFRKLVLAGLISLIGRGSIAQSVVATLIAFYFFAISYREQPFISMRLNNIKV